jgi:chorismate mutase
MTEILSSDVDPVALLRNRIDALDEGILRLVAERARLSAQVQANRIAAGGVRLELGRERQIIDSYRAALGESGPALADAILRTCRGPL